MLQLEDVHGKFLIISKRKVVKIESLGNKTRIYIEGYPLPVVTNYNFSELSAMLFDNEKVT